MPNNRVTSASFIDTEIVAMIRTYLLVCTLVAWSAAAASAGTYNTVLSIGDKAPGWEDLEGVDGRRYSLADFEGRKAVLIVFTCNTCPYSVDYQRRINELAKRNAADDSPVAVVAINSNKVADDQLPAMRQRAEEQGLVYPYLHDPTQQTAKAYGARRTPEFILLDQQRRVAYMGAFDDSADAGKVTKHYVVPAIEAVLAGKDVPVAETPPIGCSIRFERERRSR